MLLSIKSAESSDHVSGNTVYKKAVLALNFTARKNVLYSGSLSMSIWFPVRKQFLSYHSAVSTFKTQMKKRRFIMIPSTLVSPVYYSLL